MPPIRRVSMAEALAAAGVPETAPQAHAVIANPAVRAVAHALDQIANRCHARDVLSAVERLANEQDLSHAATKVAELKLAHEAAANMLELMTAQIPATHRSAPAQAPKRAAAGKEK